MIDLVYQNFDFSIRQTIIAQREMKTISWFFAIVLSSKFGAGEVHAWLDRPSHVACIIRLYYNISMMI